MGKVKKGKGNKRGGGRPSRKQDTRRDRDGNNKKKKHTWKSVRDKKSKIDRKPATQIQAATSSISSSSSTLRSRMLERLSVARFRTLNADIDSAPPSNVGANPLSEKETFESYHTGFANASGSWRENPVDLISEWIRKSVPSGHVIADFGCGAGSLAKSVPNLTHSFDLHRLDGADHVVECDMRNVPLPDSSVHVAVFCLSLMGSDVTEFLVEARRVLVDGGVLKIAEAAARLNGDKMRRFCTGMHSIGFKKTAVEEVGSGKDHVFVILEFKKLGGWGDDKKRKKSVVLGACVYKKR